MPEKTNKTFKTKQSTSDVIEQFDVPHDIVCSQRDPSLQQSDMGKIFVKNLHENIDNKQLQDIFSPFGNVVSCKVVTDDETGNCKGFGYIHYEKTEAANAAIEKLDGTLIDGHEVRVGTFMLHNNHPGQSNWTKCNIENIPLDWDEDRLCDEFAKFGLVVSVAISNDHCKEKKVKESKMKENTDTSSDNKASKIVNGKEEANEFSNACMKKGESETPAPGSTKESTPSVVVDDDGKAESRYGFVTFELHDCAVKAMKELNGKEVKSVGADGKVVIQELYVGREQKNEREGELCTNFETGKTEGTPEFQDASLFVENLDGGVIIQNLQLQIKELASELKNSVNIKY